ncbi:hypothetical protein JVW19_22030, partial [Vibrio cholerae O1]|nr:hypothetical protein [Vibrio cholerae O1]
VTDFFDLSEDRMEKLALLIDDKSGAKGSFMFIFDNRDILEICKEVFSNKIFNNLGERISKYSAEFKEGLLSVVY